MIVCFTKHRLISRKQGTPYILFLRKINDDGDESQDETKTVCTQESVLEHLLNDDANDVCTQENLLEHMYSKDSNCDKALRMEELLSDVFVIIDGQHVQCKTCLKKVKRALLNMENHLTSNYHLSKSDDLQTFNEEHARAEIEFVALGVICDDTFLGQVNSLNGLHRIFDDSGKLQSIKYKEDPDLFRKRCHNILWEVIAPAQKEKLARILQSQEFCLSIDESANVVHQQALCIVVRFVDYQKKEISETLWDVLRCHETDENEAMDAETIF